MKEVRLTETEQKVFECVKQGSRDINSVKEAMERLVGHTYSRGLIIEILKRLRGYGMIEGFRKRKNDRLAYKVAA